MRPLLHLLSFQTFAFKLSWYIQQPSHSLQCKNNYEEVPPRKQKESSPLSRNHCQASVLVALGVEQLLTGCGLPGWVEESIFRHPPSTPSHATEHLWAYTHPFTCPGCGVTTVVCTLASFPPSPRRAEAKPQHMHTSSSGEQVQSRRAGLTGWNLWPEPEEQN